MRTLLPTLSILCLSAVGLAAGDAENRTLYDLLSEKGPAAAQAAVARKHFSAEELHTGAAVAANGGDFVWAVESEREPFLYIDDKPVLQMRSLGGNLWVHTARLVAGRSHAHLYRVGGEILGGKRFDTSAFTEDSYPQAGVPQGKLSEQMIIESEVYRSWKVSYWVYASPGVDPAVPSPVMVWQDGQRFVYRGKRSRLMTVVENLVHQKKIPPMVLVLIAPGYIGGADDSLYVPNEKVRELRSILYDTVNDDYNKMVLAEIFPEVEKLYKLRSDGYSRAIAGQSSGGICAFNSAWWRPDAFGRVLSRIGSYTPLQWLRGQSNPEERWGLDDPAGFAEGGDIYPTLVRQQAKRNIRVWLEDGSYDLEIERGSWSLQNIRMANSLKMREYDFHFSFGNAQHNTQHGNAELPRAMTWLWRAYDPAKTEQEFKMDPAEKERPYFRVAVVNR